MKNNTIIATSALVALSLCNIHAQDDVSSILNKIKSEKVRNSTASASKESEKPAPKKSKQPKATKSSKKSSSSGEKIPVWGPKDKLPKNVTGHYVAGNFVLQGESYEGFAVLIPAEDSLNPFARQFKVENMSTGLAPGTNLTSSQRKFVKISRSRPLIIVGRDPMPGIYRVQAQ
jgi:hypothetical protein